MKKAHIFCQITKVDQAKREITGIMTEEVTDKVGEKMDYATSKAHFQKWSDDIAKATAGKSYGNVRLMHQPTVAGKVLEMIFDDAAKSITITTTPVNDEIWKMIDEGHLSGYSIGGNYVGKMWPDPDEPGVNRYTVAPVEVSYVDNPCLRTATFTSVKMDGSTVQEEFKLYVPTNEEVTAEAVIIAKAQGGDMFDHLEAARAALIARKAAVAITGGEEPITDDEPQTLEEKAEAAKEDGLKTVGNKADEAADVIKTDPEAPAAEEPVDWGINQVFRVEADGSVHATKSDAKQHVKAMQVLVVGASPAAKALLEAMAAAKNAGQPVVELVFADEGYQADALKRYPIDTPLNIKSSWFLAHKAAAAGAYTVGEGDDAAMDTRWQDVADTIKAAWVEKVSPDGPPAGEALSLLDPAAYGDLIAKLTPLTVSKGLYTVSSLARELAEFAWIVEQVGWEAEYEKDGSALPTQGSTILASMAAWLIAMVNEEVAELLADLPGIADLGMDGIIELSAGAEITKADQSTLTAIKGNETLMTKAGARNSKKDAAALQAIHDGAADLGAKCAGGEKAAGGDLQKVMAEKDDLEKAVAAVMPQLKEMGEELATLKASNSDLVKRVSVLSNQPAPMPAMMPGTKVVTKAQDIPGGEIAEMTEAEAMSELLAKFTPKQISDMVLAKALSTPMKAEMRGAE